MTSPPSAQSQLVDANRLPTSTWMQFFAGLVGAPSGILPATVTTSPFSYTAPASGTLAIVGGTIAAVAFTRARVTIPLAAAAGLIPMGNGDTVKITYTKAPNVSFIPS